MKSLDPAQRRALRAKAHHLHPVVSIGNQGLTPAVLHEIDLNLMAHELVKVRVHSDDRAQRDQLFVRICDELDAAPVQHLGKVLVLYRERPPDEEEAAPKALKTARKTAQRMAREAPRARSTNLAPASARASSRRRTPKPGARQSATSAVAASGRRRTAAAGPGPRARAPEGKHAPRARRRRG